MEIIHSNKYLKTFKAKSKKKHGKSILFSLSIDFYIDFFYYLKLSLAVFNECILLNKDK